LTLADELRSRAQTALPALRRAGALAAPVTRHPHFGAYASLAAIGLGALLMAANIAHEHRAAPAVAARLAAPAAIPAAVAKASPIRAEAAKPPPDPIAAIATASPALPKAAEKITQRIDTTPTASIAEKEPAKPKRARHHAHRRKHAESER
jgi:hypothetical protein